jgi:NAD(P)-dependent dehydrogenase (short-subunit alcohol dehydrogenase family)
MTDAPAAATRGPRAVIVTGGTGALGEAVVTALLARGARVAVPYRKAAEWDALRASCRGSDETLFGRAADMSDAKAAADFVDEAVKQMGHLDGVAAIAGAYAGSGTLEAAPPDEWGAMLAANLATAWAACRAALPYLVKAGGSVVTIGSLTAERAGAGASGYAVSKSAVHALTRVLALENQSRGVRFNCVLPGTIDTPANRRAMPNADTKRWTPPAALARVIVFLLSPESAPVTGAFLPVDGPA